MKIQCPDDCHYRRRDAPICGVCLKDILNTLSTQKEEGGDGCGQKRETQTAGKTD